MNGVDLYYTLREGAEGLGPALAELRRALHRHPELGFEERWTAGRLLEELAGLDLEVLTGIGRTGVVAVLHGARPGPTVGLRACLDALPIVETTGAPYASAIAGVSHACGHDGQCACLVGAARLLSPLRDRLPGRVALIFQPAEEIDQGAAAMLGDRVLERVPLEAVFAIHGHGGLAAGTIGLRPGPITASIDTVTLRVRGHGGHGALPHRTTDAIVAASAIVTQLQSIVARGVDPLEPAVVTIGTFHAGEAPNVVAGAAELSGTVRAASPAVRDRLHQLIRRVAQGTAAALGAGCDVALSLGLPAVANDARLVDLLRGGLTAVLGSGGIAEPPLVMGGDDFSLFAERVPAACYIWLGEADPDTGRSHPWHAADFDLDERALPVGAFVLAAAALLSLGGVSDPAAGAPSGTG